MPLDIQIQKNTDGPDALTVQLSGSLDTATAPDLERTLAPVLAGHEVKNLVFDLAQLKFITSAGLRIFASTRKPLEARGGTAFFVNLQPQIKQVFDIIAALPGISVFGSVAELDRYLAALQKAATPNA
jgi:anti-sigma B factor antagonist